MSRVMLWVVDVYALLVVSVILWKWRWFGGVR